MPVRRVALLGTHAPRRCGIATFTHDLARSIADAAPDTDVVVVAMTGAEVHEYPPRVRFAVEQDDLAAYAAAADRLNEMAVDVLCVQHEFGIFGGPAGSYLLTMLRGVRAPIVTTLHTVLEAFTPEQQAVVEELVLLSSTVVVMSERAVGFLVAQGVPRNKIALVHHGIPEAGFARDAEKARLDLSSCTLMLTFGLLSPNKGIETAIRALPAVVREFPEVLYLVLGTTHPNVRARNGEEYRDGLIRLASELGVAEHVRFDDRFAEDDELVRVIAAADVYLTPYLGREQITSGTLAYAVGSGKAVVSTPFWYAEELLAEDRGVLVPFRDPPALGDALLDLLRRPDRRAAMEDRARAYGERMRWPRVARAYAGVFDAAIQARPVPSRSSQLPPLNLEHVSAMSDGTGLLQHATVAIPNPHEGYTTDDNARALQLATLAPASPRSATIARRAMSFLHHAFDPSSGRFRNFMAYDRRWLDADGGDNAQARAVRALVGAAHGLPGALGRTARELLTRCWRAVEGLGSPRAQAIALLALAERMDREGPDPAWISLADGYGGNLSRLYEETATPHWPWFEAYLSYSNAKLSHGLLAYGRAFGRPVALDRGLRSLRWLEEQQTAPDGAFLPVGSERVYNRGEARPLWDGQPVEVYATVAACLEAHRVSADPRWLAAARRALEWLVGRNALGLSLHDAETGGCRDGLHRDRANANQGAESTLALWLSVAEYDRVMRSTATRFAAE